VALLFVARGGGDQRHPPRCRPRRSPASRASPARDAVGVADPQRTRRAAPSGYCDRRALISLTLLDHGAINERDHSQMAT
jgi:hypothetical protein